MQDLPIYPERSAQVADALERRRTRLADVRNRHHSAYQTAMERCLIATVHETLGLTGDPFEMREIERSAGNLDGGGGGEAVIRGQIQALRRVEAEARSRPKASMGLQLVTEVQRLCNPEATGAFRTDDAPKQFASARKSPPAQIGARLTNLFEWLASQTGQDMKTADRCALFFARYLEIAPFDRRNFRSAHLLMNFFPLASGYPMICLRLEDAAAIREEVERAMQFDTESLVRRFEGAIGRALDECEGLLGVRDA